MHRAIAEIDPQIPFDHDESLVSVFVIMPDEVALQLHNLELVIVHLSDHFWLPFLMEQAKLLHEVDCPVLHLISSTFAVLSHPTPRHQRVGTASNKWISSRRAGLR